MFEKLKKLKDIVTTLISSYTFLIWMVASVSGFVQMYRANQGISPNDMPELSSGVIKTDVAQVCVQEADGTIDCINIEPAQSVKILVEVSKYDPNKKILVIKK